MNRIDNPNRAYQPPVVSQFGPPTFLHIRQTLNRDYQVWSAALGNGYKWFATGPNMNAGSGTPGRDREDAEHSVERFMDTNVPGQMEERAGHTLPTERLQYIDGTLTIVDYSAQWNRYFPANEQVGEKEGSVGIVEAAPTGLGGYYLRRFKRIDGMLREERPGVTLKATVMPLVLQDIQENYWGAKVYDHTPYPVAADIANAVFPQTDPPYEPLQLRAEDEALVLSRRGRGLVGDPVKGKPNEEERLYAQQQQHLDDRASLRDQF